MNKENLRYERKFIIPAKSKYFLKHIINCSELRFYEQYRERVVNSIYLDDINLRFFNENIDGQNVRQKLRIRWYGNQDIIQNPCLEIKKKNNKLGNKTLYNLNGFKLVMSNNIINPLIIYLNKKRFAKTFINDLKMLEPTLFVSYKRNYYISKLSNFRVTFDEEIKYKKINTRSKFALKSHSAENKMIMEVKYSPDVKDHYLNFLSQLPFRLSKNSKYINGIMQFLD